MAISKQIPINNKTFQNEHKVKEDNITHIYRAEVISPYFDFDESSVAIRGGLRLSLVDEIEKARYMLSWSIPPFKKGKKRTREEIWSLTSPLHGGLVNKGGALSTDSNDGYKYQILHAARDKGIFSLGESLLEDICKPIDEALISFYKENTVEYKN